MGSFDQKREMKAIVCGFVAAFTLAVVASGANAAGVDEFGFVRKLHDSPQAALSAAKGKSKPIFMAVYDKKHLDQAKVKWNLSGLIGWDATKKLLAENFVQALVERKKVKDMKQIQLPDPFEEVLVFFLTPEGEVFHTEQIKYNAETGYQRINEILAEWKTRGK